jgi:hypothetical protein
MQYCQAKMNHENTNTPWWRHYYTRRKRLTGELFKKQEAVGNYSKLVAQCTEQSAGRSYHGPSRVSTNGGNKQNAMTLHETLMWRPEKSRSTTINPDKTQFILLFRPKMPSPRSIQE